MGRFTRSVILGAAWLALLGLIVPRSAVALDAEAPAPNPSIFESARLGDLSRTSGCPGCEPLDFRRQPLTNSVAHYSWTLQVGPGELDRLGFHRVVRELAPYVPAPSRDAVLLTHGARTGFAGTFLSTVGPAGLDPAHNLPVYLAQRGIDVWGFDMRWTLIPADTTDLSPLADWGLARDADDLGLALTLARTVRRLTGHGGRRLDLLGYSYGGRVGYTYLNAETRTPRRKRQVDRYIALEGLFKTADEALQQEACGLADVLRDRIDSGQVASDSQPLALIGRMALDAPDEPSQAVPGFTNRQAALFLGAQTVRVGLLPIHGFVTDFEGPLPTGRRFTPEAASFNLFASASGFQPLANGRDLMVVLCDDGRSSLDDRLDKVRVPVLYLGAAGGFDHNGLDTFPFLGSRIQESLVIAFEPPGNEAVDVGHGDIVMMDTADQLVWEPILDWVMAR